MTKYLRLYSSLAALLICICAAPSWAKVPAELVYQTGKLKPVDSVLKVAVGETAPDFALPSLAGKAVQLSSFSGKKNVVISFVPAAFTPICSDQWPGYNIAQELFEQNDAILLGITADNIPTQYAWTRQMNEGGVWFPVLSDFWPHGKVAQLYGVLRTDGTTERAIFIIDKKGIIRYIDVHDINTRPDLGEIIRSLRKINK
ncbi:Peroxiredoxin [Maridesulfovibrio ferrireducens]|uniref:Peroxiredoxin n=1 Tax=Maridesulfovibrio ferrireducens TaxID=246191 RepID=A0A1G9FUG6_9BACT|nr:peroxiredoxin [Maridesulfovibrio ferrireducens]SDK92076.1 Peroxiredoxin [Maridesulfovibrio ferrireducens]